MENTTDTLLGIGDTMIGSIKKVLLQYRKVATKRTYNSLEKQVIKEGETYRVIIWSDVGMKYIITGRKKGGKLPVRKVGNKFELVPRLKAWAKAVFFTGSYYLLARKIARDGIKGIPIVEIAEADFEEKISSDIDKVAKTIIKEKALIAAKQIFENV